MRTVLITALWTFLADQAVKYLVVHALNLRMLGEIDVLPPYLNLRMAWNTGINFGLLQGQTELARWGLIAVALLIVVAVLVWVWRERMGWFGHLSAGLLVGGALGNVVDRLIYGAVADFLNMSCCGIENPYAFNIADIAVFVGAFGLVFLPGSKKVA